MLMQFNKTMIFKDHFLSSCFQNPDHIINLSNAMESSYLTDWEKIVICDANVSIYW